MSNFYKIEIPTEEKFHEGCRKFEESEGRDSMYKVATFLVDYYWGKPADMADALGVLLLTWNMAFYRYGSLNFDKIENCICNNLDDITSFREREIFSLSEYDELVIKKLFREFLNATMIDYENYKARSPVSVAKALHLLAPKFFPLWDKRIANAYNHDYSTAPEDKYISFCKITKCMAENMKGYKINPNKSLIKQIDEYNYAKYTQGWI